MCVCVLPTFSPLSGSEGISKELCVSMFSPFPSGSGRVTDGIPVFPSFPCPSGS